MLYRYTLAGISAVALSSLVAACGSDADSPGTATQTGGVEDAQGGGGATQTGSGGATQTGSGGATQTGSGGGATTTKTGDGAGMVLAMNKLFLGDTDRNGTPSSAAWKMYGLNLDGKVSTKADKDLCKPPKGGAPSSTYPDGDDGIDNAFGKLIMPIVGGLTSYPTASTQATIDEGRFTIMLAFDKLGSDKDYNPLLTRLYNGAPLGTPPAWDGTDAWPLVSEQLNDPTDPSSAKVQFAASHLADNTWVSGSGGTVTLSIIVAGAPFPFLINEAILRARLAADHRSATDGVIAGILDTEQFIEGIRKIAGNIDPYLCEGSAFEGLAQQLRGASDIMKDGSQDPSKTCDGISIGLGFDASEVKLGAIAPPVEPAPDPCN
jgi:hypothetical protein